MTDERSQFEAWNKCYSTIIHALDDIVRMDSDDNDRIRRDPVMAKVMNIRLALDAYGQAARAAPAQDEIVGPFNSAEELISHLPAPAPAQPAGERVLLVRHTDRLIYGFDGWRQSCWNEPDTNSQAVEYAWATIEPIKLSPESVVRVVDATKELLAKSEIKQSSA
jgi:hypothetical protein